MVTSSWKWAGPKVSQASCEGPERDCPRAEDVSAERDARAGQLDSGAYSTAPPTARGVETRGADDGAAGDTTNAAVDHGRSEPLPKGVGNGAVRSDAVGEGLGAIRLDTLAIHAGRRVLSALGAVIDPINMSVTYERDPDGSYPNGYFYSSAGNPNRDSLEECINALEGGSGAVAFSSGSAAIAAVLRTLHPGAHVVVPRDVFQGTIRILANGLADWGISYTTADMTDIDSVQAAFNQDTKLLWAETLSNPLLRVADIEALAQVAHSCGALMAVDNTLLTPVFSRPLAMGADFVIHATTKYLGGHGDVVGGIVGCRHAEHESQVRRLQRDEGAVPSTFDCWLVHRGIKTLPHRMRVHSSSAMKVARCLEHNPMIEAVHYPGLPCHPQHELARKLMDGYGGVVSVQVRGGPESALRVAGNVQLFTHATSLGQTDSLIQHQASSPTHGPGAGIDESLLRLSVGLEHPDDLIEDLESALRVASQTTNTQT